MENNLKPVFQSYHGLQTIVTSNMSLNNLIKEQLRTIKNRAMGNKPIEITDDRLDKIYLLDTFFSDTLNEEVIHEIFNSANINSYSVKLLLVNPFSPIGLERAKYLPEIDSESVNPLKEINKSLHNIIRCISKILRSEVPSYFNNNNEQSFNDKLNIINEFDFDIQVRFYNIPIEAPIYIIKQFLNKGLLLHRESTAYNPWLVFINNPLQSGDIYDHLFNNFESVWADSVEFPSNREFNNDSRSINEDNIFITHGHNEKVTLKIKNFLQDILKLKPIIFNENNIHGDTVIEDIERLTNVCGKAIIIQTKDDEMKNGGIRARQNVLHEMGYFYGKIGRRNTLLLMEEGIEQASNIVGINGVYFSPSKIEACYEEIRKFLHKQ